MRLPFTVLAALAMAVSIAGCSSGTPTGPTLAPGATATLAPVPTSGGSTPGAVTGHECDAVPTFSVANPNPSFAPDAVLLAKFPTTIDGQPVTDVSALPSIDFLCLGGQAAFNQAAGSNGGSGFATMSWGGFTANVDGSDVSVWAFRQPGGDANVLTQTIAGLAAAAGHSVVVGQLTTTTVAGKTVYTWTDDDGNKGFAYASGDTLIGFDGVTDAQANKILSALPA